MASVRQVVDLTKDDDDEVRRSMDGNTERQTRLGLRDDSDIVGTGQWS